MCNSESGLATAVDVVCWRGERLWLVEVKAGWDSNHTYDEWCGPMRGLGRSSLPDSPRNQHMLQLLVTRALFCSTFNLPPTRVEAAVARVSADGVRFQRLPEATGALEARVMQRLALHVRG